MQNKVVNGLRDLGVTKGATGPHIIECDDGKTYVVKFADGTKTVVNEFVGHALARAVGLPVPAAAFVVLGADLIGGSSDLTYRAVGTGPHVGSELIPDVMDFDQFGRLGQQQAVELSNAGVLPGTLCHDNWVLTRDRDRSDNHLVQALNGEFRYTMVDFTHAFTGPAWTADAIEQGSYLRVLMPMHPFVAVSVAGLASFIPTLEKVEAVGDSEIEEIVSAIPQSWGIAEEERLLLVNFLELRRGLVRGVLTSNRARFPNWRD
jgi:hypothetical protein